MRKQLGSWLIAAGLVALGAIGYGWAQQQVTPAAVAITCAFNNAQPTLTTGNFGFVQCDQFGKPIISGNNPIVVNTGGAAGSGTAGYPVASNNTFGTPITASATGTTAGGAATLAAAVGKTTYICGFQINAQATTAIGGTTTVSGTITGSLNFIEPIAATPAVGTLTQVFTPCVPASATNTAIVVGSAAPGTGGLWAASAWGFQL